jgi:hypothetical protein
MGGKCAEGAGSAVSGNDCWIPRMVRVAACVFAKTTSPLVSANLKSATAPHSNGSECLPSQDQYQVSTDKRSGIVNDPNREDDPEYILRLIGQVIHVSLETVKRTRELAALALLPAETSPAMSS